MTECSDDRHHVKSFGQCTVFHPEDPGSPIMANEEANECEEEIKRQKKMNLQILDLKVWKSRCVEQNGVLLPLIPSLWQQ